MTTDYIKRKNTPLHRINKPAIAITGALLAAISPTTNAQDCDPIQSAKLIAPDAAIFDWFGSSVSISANTLICGASSDDTAFGTQTGSAYIYTKTASQWTLQEKILPDDAASDDFFGESVSISNEFAIIGAPGNDDRGSGSGSAYIFIKFADEWIQIDKLTASDGTTLDRFGVSVAISGDTAVVGAPFNDSPASNSGSVYIYNRNGFSWNQQAKITADDGLRNDEFGTAVAIHGDTVIVSSPNSDQNGSNSGSAYIFTRSNGVWTQQAKLLPDDGAADDEFGTSVSIIGDTAIIGAPKNDQLGSNSGSAYIFTRTQGVWTQQQHLLPDDGIGNIKFGNAVSIIENAAIIGAFWSSDFDTGSGAAYYFQHTKGLWSQRAKLLPSDPGRSDFFGNSVAIDADSAVIGAWWDDHPDQFDTSRGSAYTFDLNPPMPADLNQDGILDFFDISAFLASFSAHDPIADFTADGQFDFFDISAFLTAFSAGCPI